MKKGTIKFYNNDKGFGLIKEEINNNEYYFHLSNFNSDVNPLENDKVEFEIGKGKNNRPAAFNVTPKIVVASH